MQYLSKNTVGILAGGGGAAVGVVAAKMLSAKSIDAAAKDKKDAPKWATYLAENPWAGGVAGGVISLGALYALKKRDQILPAFLSHAAIVAPVFLISYLAKADMPKELAAGTTAAAAPAAAAPGGMGIAVASRGMGRDTVTMYSAPPKLRLSGTSNAPSSSNLVPAAVPVFGGQGF